MIHLDILVDVTVPQVPSTLKYIIMKNYTY